MSAIPLVDLAAQHREVAAEIELGFARVMETTAFVQGPEVAAFEQAFAAFSGVRHCVGVASGTDAIELALRAAGVGPGDEVILPANTFIATAEAVARSGATPVLVDCDPEFLLIDVDAVAGEIRPETKAIVPVHLFGQMAPMDRLRELAGRAGRHPLRGPPPSHRAPQTRKPPRGLRLAGPLKILPAQDPGRPY